MSLVKRDKNITSLGNSKSQSDVYYSKHPIDEENVLIKCRILNKRFGLFKSLVIKNQQYLLFNKTLRMFIKLNHSSINKVIIVKRIYDYIYLCTDIWFYHNELIKIFEQQMINFSKIDFSIKPYLEKFGLSCCYIKRDGIKCNKLCDNFLCKIHKNCKNNLIRLINSLDILQKDTKNIVIQYLLNKNCIIV